MDGRDSKRLAGKLVTRLVCGKFRKWPEQSRNSHNVWQPLFCRAKTAQCCLSVSECQICARYAFWNLTRVRKALRGGLQVAAAISEQVWLLLTCQVNSTFPSRVIGGRIRRLSTRRLIVNSRRNAAEGCRCRDQVSCF